MLDRAYMVLYVVSMSILALCILFILIRAIRGPRLTDRIVCSNMAGTVVIMIIAILSQWIGEGYLADICIIYAAISFVAVVVLYRVYTNKYRRIDIKTLEAIPGAKAKIEDDNRKIMTRRNRYKRRNTTKRSKKRVHAKGGMEG
ncbi:MAG: monovalent cation/H+ antiporter complex subunit F [Clostridium sp.]|nr:monovalent cation/H+ antiporter complex subunit F [Clostridium sp.]MCM1171331.1 monovalent cation/H+ antiporter complex subunit F [Clostridium sp.]MCM1208532.1 monovalent cation/H+ antiporter complex subunit F [Ruminococcus sp.]